MLHNTKFPSSWEEGNSVTISFRHTPIILA